MAIMETVIKSMPIALLLYWALATGAALFALLPGGMAPSFRAAVLLSASRGKTWEDKPKAPLGPLTDVHVPQSWFMHFYMLHLTRRLLESVLLFDYPASARMHFIAYIFGLSYYIVLPLSLLPGSQWERLRALSAMKDQHLSWSSKLWRSGQAGQLSNLADATRPALLLGICVFVAGNLLQFQSHWILARLRRQLSSQGKKEGDYSIPRGGAFELVSCPHYLGEIVIYGGLMIMLGRHNSLIYIIFCWVVANLLLAAGPTHRWYRGHFKQYPENRRALIPFLY
ncbi:Polyprenol reductase 1 [Coccomyxa sp. Obi]|nr:Polyprenol reductase 1 [Coccomyxa sp. Obi]